MRHKIVLLALACSMLPALAADVVQPVGAAKPASREQLQACNGAAKQLKMQAAEVDLALAESDAWLQRLEGQKAGIEDGKKYVPKDQAVADYNRRCTQTLFNAEDRTVLFLQQVPSDTAIANGK
ncbi:MAG: hypothetical protein HYZ45_11380 [Burkholderiales bacterium]|nr:hypothetical protein [Burkholderiales bacterium]